VRARWPAWTVLALLPLVGVPATAAAPPDRVVTAAYQGPGGLTTGSGATLFGNPTASASSRSDEDRVAVSTSELVALAVDVTRPGTATTRTLVCGRAVLQVSPGTKVAVTPLAGVCPNGSLSMPLDGTVRWSFHRLPPTPRGAASPFLRWAVVIGIRDYAGRTHSTIGGAGDAAAVRRALLAAGWLPDHILMVTESGATAQGIRNAMTWLAARSTPHTFSLLHYSGHICIKSRGPCAAGHTWLWAHDNAFISESEVRSRMLKVRGHSWLDVAGCEAGAFDLHSASRMFSGSSKASETSYEDSDWHESYWTGLTWDRGFTMGLADDQGRQNRATIGEMTAYGKREAPPLTTSGEKGSQHPVVLGGSPAWTLYAPPGG
jgi:hypothetical protein